MPLTSLTYTARFLHCWPTERHPCSVNASCFIQPEPEFTTRLPHMAVFNLGNDIKKKPYILTSKPPQYDGSGRVRHFSPYATVLHTWIAIQAHNTFSKIIYVVLCWLRVLPRFK